MAPFGGSSKAVNASVHNKTFKTGKIIKIKQNKPKVNIKQNNDLTNFDVESIKLHTETNS